LKHRVPIIGDGSATFGASDPAPAVDDEQLLQYAREHLNLGFHGRKWVLIVRDPRDVAISECYHLWKGCGQADQYVTARINNIAAWVDLRYRFFKAVQELAPQRVPRRLASSVAHWALGYTAAAARACACRHLPQLEKLPMIQAACA